MQAPTIRARPAGPIGRSSARIARIGADARDDSDLREKKALLVLLAVLILPVSLVWGASYLAFGSRVGVLPVHLLRHLARFVGGLLEDRGGSGRSSPCSSSTCSS